MTRVARLTVALAVLGSAAACAATGPAAVELPADPEARAQVVREFAERGDPESQFRLGLMYRDGSGVVRDPVLAHVWFQLASIGGHEPATGARDELAARMTAAELEEAQQVAEEWATLYFIRSID